MSNRKIDERGKIDNPNTYIHLTWLGAYTSITSFGVSQSSPLGEMRLTIKKKYIAKVYNSIENKTNLIINTYC